MNTISEIEGHLASTKIELKNFNCKKSAASATRARAHILKIKKLCDVSRKQILAECKSNKSNKSKIVVEEPESESEPEPVVEVVEKVKKTRKPRVKKT
jgi:hypothetical protein